MAIEHFTTLPLRSDAIDDQAYVDEVEQFFDELNPRIDDLNEAVDDINAVTSIVARGLVGRSVTPLTIGEGDHVLVADAGKGWFPGQGLIFAMTADPLRQMLVIVETYDPETGALTGNTPLGQTAGVGDAADWIIGPAPASPQTSKASAAEIFAHLDDSKFVTAYALAAAGAFQVLNDAATITINADAGWNFGSNGAGGALQLGAARTFNISGGYDGQTIHWKWDCNGYVPAFNAIIDWGIAGTPVPVTTAGKVHRAWATKDAALGKWIGTYRAPA